MRTFSAISALGVVLLWVLSPTDVMATAQITDVIDAAEDDDPFDLHLEVTHHFVQRRAKVVTELALRSTLDPTTGYVTPGHYSNKREFRIEDAIHTLDIDLEIGLFHDLELFATFPIVLSEANELYFAAGVLPEAPLVTQRFTQEEVDELIKGPLNGGKHLYTVAWPPI